MYNIKEAAYLNVTGFSVSIEPDFQWGRLSDLPVTAAMRKFVRTKKERMNCFMVKRVAIIMGSDSDLPTVKKASDKLSELGIPYEMRIMSAHRTPADVASFAGRAAKSGYGVIIAAAGKAAHLAGFIAAHTTLPVIGVPIKSSTLDGLDALLATVQMPSGVPVATVAIDGAENAAILAAEIISVHEPELQEKLNAMRESMADSVRDKDALLQENMN